MAVVITPEQTSQEVIEFAAKELVAGKLANVALKALRKEVEKLRSDISKLSSPAHKETISLYVEQMQKMDSVSSSSVENLKAYKDELKRRNTENFEKRIEEQAAKDVRAKVAENNPASKKLVTRRQSDQALQPKPNRDAATASLLDDSENRRHSYNGLSSVKV